ncbi:MarR family winged helix-turn-helix transcriptional regulator [Lactococcus termiticola]|uniref:MarR family transcriptional regulator n=1 Tax=Lactococcus termiticola TaxID=2169526 RepID=A0A2R5HDP0_9LACT|nr:MarR family transcriptional regulator [Lactococcus termiticola]GBG96169.1 MarR family transcriptional regulator [Lactococcus termiticola]
MKTDFDQVNEWLIQLFHDFMILEEQFLKESDYSEVTVKELQQLTLVHTLGSCRATDIAKNQKLALSTITITLNRLESKGYIKRDRSEKDRRVTHVALTDEGEALCAKHREYFRSITESLMNSVYGTTENKLAGELSSLHKHLEDMK